MKYDFSKIEYLALQAGVRYYEDAEVNGIKEGDNQTIPCTKTIINRDGKDQIYWCPIIDIKTGRIINWDQGVLASTWYKVCDDGFYSCLDSDMNEIFRVESYVPSIIDLDGDSFGDYISFNINCDGFIEGWEEPTENEYIYLIENSFNLSE